MTEEGFLSKAKELEEIPGEIYCPLCKAELTKPIQPTSFILVGECVRCDMCFVMSCTTRDKEKLPNET